MARLLQSGTWFDLLPPGAMSESDFENILCQNPHLLAENCFLRPFKMTVRGAERDGRPDLVLVDHEYRFWWVIEVERGDHDLIRHVLPQIQCFRTASYGSEVAEYLIKKNPDLDQARLYDLMLGDPPEVAVVSALPSCLPTVAKSSGWCGQAVISRA